jgi:hypothetical protein
MTGELAPARHVPSAATRAWEPGSDLPHGAALVAASHLGRSDPGDRHIRQNQTRPIYLRGYRHGHGVQAKADARNVPSALGITQWMTACGAQRDQTKSTKQFHFASQISGG